MKLFQKIKNQLKTKISSCAGDYFSLSPRMVKCQKITSPEKKRILIVGVVLGDRTNHYNHISKILNNSKQHDVQQVWAVLKSKNKLSSRTNINLIYFDEFIPRSKLINSLLANYSNKSYDYIIITDDDIRLPKDFLDQFLKHQSLFDFSLAQPARTPNSIISHTITKQCTKLLARQTLFVDIGPMISIRSDVQKIILPLDESSPMGWGLDYVWPTLLLNKNKKMGIIDSTPIAHTLRPVGKSYNSKKALNEMSEYLCSKPHLNEKQAHVVLAEFRASLITPKP